MMGRTGSDGVEAALEETILNYKRTGKDEDGPSLDLFRADLSGGRPEKSPWNIRLAEIFTDDYTKKKLPFRQLKEVTDFFLTYILSLQSAHRKMTRASTSGRGTVHESVSKNNRIRGRKKSVRLLNTLLYNYTDNLIKLPAFQKPIKRSEILWD
jgi:hypothetical protein